MQHCLCASGAGPFLKRKKCICKLWCPWCYWLAAAESSLCIKRVKIKLWNKQRERKKWVHHQIMLMVADRTSKKKREKKERKSLYCWDDTPYQNAFSLLSFLWFWFWIATLVVIWKFNQTAARNRKTSERNIKAKKKSQNAYSSLFLFHEV